CERERLRYQSYFLWKRKFGDEPGPAEKGMTFAPVTVVPRVSAGAGGLEIVLPGDRRVMVHAPVDRQALADVLAVLGRPAGAGGVRGCGGVGAPGCASAEGRPVGAALHGMSEQGVR
ncbi:MAG TPA: hypothetical protein VH253_05185, partial [Phycisphaerae bacterium]|nr:hypothetical protein [Phycisphaerae bacterium]